MSFSKYRIEKKNQHCWLWTHDCSYLAAELWDPSGLARRDNSEQGARVQVLQDSKFTYCLQIFHQNKNWQVTEWGPGGLSMAYASTS